MHIQAILVTVDDYTYSLDLFATFLCSMDFIPRNTLTFLIFTVI